MSNLYSSKKIDFMKHFLIYCSLAEDSSDTDDVMGQEWTEHLQNGTDDDMFNFMLMDKISIELSTNKLKHNLKFGICNS